MRLLLKHPSPPSGPHRHVPTIGALISSCAPGLTKYESLSKWPPDVFALAGVLLKVTGVYRCAVRNAKWRRFKDDVRARHLEALAAEWRRAAAREQAAPEEIRQIWRRVVAKKTRDKPISVLNDDENLRHDLFDLVGMADDACKDVGVPYVYTEAADQFLERAARQILQSTSPGTASTLCSGHIASSVVCVLPKCHVPQVGMTFRSMTHFLALCQLGELLPTWILAPPPASAGRLGAKQRLLLVPSPHVVKPEQFRIVHDRRCGRASFPDDQRFFSYVPESREEWLQTTFRAILEQAVRTGPIDGVIFPELSLPSDDELNLAHAILSEVCPLAFILAGVGGPDPHDHHRNAPGRNTAQYIFPSQETDTYIKFIQRKHHRWRVTDSQQKQYGIDLQLDEALDLWEHIDLPDRRIHFCSTRSWFTYCFLICEDLARQEPVAELVRAVGPDLVIALLFDGPQLSERWPGQYATILADDPGSSVLTLTNIGMVELCSTPPKRKPSRSIALWKDRTGKATPIDLAKGAAAVVVTLVKEKQEEFSIDGRSDARAEHLLLQSVGGKPCEQIRLAPLARIGR